ncbi:MAG: thioredoxin-disulfide reductase [Holosporaceae bacterium]|jgi:thioredoxin reductase (NADPH)|nr:thioredoxin-disulfide reductase [Holosporaceae bacterium]
MESDVLILGSGPAGYTAAIYAARAGRSVKLIAGPQPGGQLTITSTVENYPGFAAGISGPELMDQMGAQVLKYGVTIVQDVICSVDFSAGPPQCIGESGVIYTGKSIIIATGATARWLGIPGEKEYRGSGVSACATCDGFFFRNKSVAVVGGGNSAVEEAIFLTNFAQSVTLIHRRNTLAAEKLLQKRLQDNPRIHCLWNTVVTDILGDGLKVKTLLLKNIDDDSISEIAVDGVFVAIGHSPATSAFTGALELDKNGGIVTFAGTSTSVPGIFAAGDVCDDVYKQAITAAAQGCMAALDADKFLSTNI